LAVRPPTASTLGRRFLSAAGVDSDSAAHGAKLVDRAIAGIVGRARGRYLLAIDVVAMLAAAYLALALRFDRLIAPEIFVAFLPVIVLMASVRITANAALGIYGRDWRFASVPDLERIAGAVLLGSFMGATVFYVIAVGFHPGWTDGFPRSFWLVEMLISIALLGGTRFAVRVATDAQRGRSRAVGADQRATLLWGAGHTGVLMARSAQREPSAGVLPVGFLDDDPNLAGNRVAGLRVFGGLETLGRAIAETGAQALLITMPSAPGDAVRRVVDAAMGLGLEVRTVPSISDLLDGSVDAYRVRNVRVEDLIRRPIVAEHAAAVDEIIRDRTVMVTGAGGSIGSELARQVFAIGPRKLVLVDRAESPLYLIQRELETRRARGQGSGELSVQLANVTNRASMERLVNEDVPSVILHAAAYKQVPLMEATPSDAVYVNIGGTLALLDAAAAAGVERFVFVSTDKAVKPTSVMGASKRVAEMLVADEARRSGRPYVSVRFGNVLGSTGSVVPIFQEQLEKGEPLTITHPDMTRFFMTIQEAAWLILDAAAFGSNGDLFVLDMGAPIRIMDLARDLVRLAGRNPDHQPIEIVGLRPGEKLHEELFYDVEQVQRTPNPKVLRAVAPPVPRSVREDARALLDHATGRDEQGLRELLVAYAGRVGGHPVGARPHEGRTPDASPRLAVAPGYPSADPMAAFTGPAS